jgi:hypothetical protein
VGFGRVETLDLTATSLGFANSTFHDRTCISGLDHLQIQES